MHRAFLLALVMSMLVGCRVHRYRTVEEPVPETAIYEGVPAQNLPPVAAPPRQHAVISATPRPTQQQIETETSATAPATATPRAASSGTATTQFPVAKPVPGKPGFVYSPYDGAMIDVTGFASGSKAKDPATNKIFIVP